MKNYRNVILRDFAILKGGHFGLLLTGVDNLTIDNLTIDTDRDGMDIDCCRNVRVTNCVVNSPWDGTIIDGSFKRFGHVTDPEMRPGYTGRIKCGTESNGGFRNITISNCIFEGCKGLGLETVDGALLEDITISNITMRDVVTSPLFLRLGARLRGPAEATKIGALRRVLISNLVSYNIASVVSSIVSGIPGHNILALKKIDNRTL